MFNIEKFKKYVLKKGFNKTSLEDGEMFCEKNIKEAIDGIEAEDLSNPYVLDLCYAVHTINYNHSNNIFN